MNSVNKMILIGNLGKDPEKVQFDGGSVVRFPVAMNESWTDKQSGERREHAEWANIAIWNEALAEVALTYLRKGSKVYLEGKMETRSFTKDGQKHFSTEIALRPFHGALTLLGDPPERPDAQPSTRRTARPAPRQ